MRGFGRQKKKRVTVNGVTFTDSESFGLFMEGLRSLKLYSEESEKEIPDRKRLIGYLGDALERLGKCETYFPRDILPLYSLGLALTMRNQIRYANFLLQYGQEATPKKRSVPIMTLRYKDIGGRSEPPDERRLSDAGRYLDKPPNRPWPLLDHAIELFQKVKDVGPETLLISATFNLAHVYTKRDSTEDVEKAEQLLEGIPWDLSTPPDPASLLSRIKTSFAGGEDRTATHVQPKEETVVNFLHAQILLEATRIKRRLEGDKSEGIMPHPGGTVQRLGGVRKAIDSAKIPSAKKADLEADYWTKAGQLSYEEAFALGPNERPLEFDRGMRDAEDYLRRALQFKENWNSAQIYLAQNLQGQGRIEDAKKILQQIVGIPAPEQETAAVREEAGEKAKKETKTLVVEDWGDSDV